MGLRRLAGRLLLGAGAAVLLWGAHSAPASAAGCRREVFEGGGYVVCRVDLATDDLRLFHSGANGRPYRSFRRLRDALDGEGLSLAFAMNAGMFHRDLEPVGLYVENGVERMRLVTSEGPGNFHMMPNGVFYVEDGRAHVVTTEAYAAAAPTPELATQSGPMLVIDGALHPRFIPGSDFREYRNGVGVVDEQTVVFAISEGYVNFHDFARFFRDHLGAANALYLDGSISSLYAPEAERADWFYSMGPIVGVVVPKP
jgi:prepilin-type processing-associated H-X9-DG protein